MSRASGENEGMQEYDFVEVKRVEDEGKCKQPISRLLRLRDDPRIDENEPSSLPVELLDHIRDEECELNE